MGFIKRNLNLFSTLLFLIGFTTLFKIFFPVINQEIDYRMDQLIGNDSPVIIKASQANDISKFDYKLQETAITPKDYEFSLVVPKIGINTTVAANVDSSDKSEYLPVLKDNGAAHAKSSSLPNQPGSVFIFGHSTDSFFNVRNYNATFFLLRKLEKYDDVHIFYNNYHYQYQVTDKKVVKPQQVPLEVKKADGNVLILQTCAPPGTTLKRLLVFAKLVKE